MDHYRSQSYEENCSLSYFDFGSKFVIVAYILMHLSTVAYVIFFATTHSNINNYETVLSMQFARLIGWPLVLLAFATFAGSLVFLARNGYHLETKYSYLVTHLFFLALFGIDLVITFTNFNLLKHILLW